MGQLTRGPQDLKWIAMRLDDQRAGAQCEQSLQSEYVIGRFQNPSSGWKTELKLLQKAFLQIVGEAKVRCVQKRLVSEPIAHRNELSGEQRVTIDHHAFIWCP